jgi:phenylpyruvate tautomerase PptA (4-oxalocrotonate tautomerase family)
MPGDLPGGATVKEEKKRRFIAEVAENAEESIENKTYRTYVI